jgi:hypothetical protein
MMARVPAALLLLAALQSGSEGFFFALQRAVASNDRPAVAGLMAYPLNVTAGGTRLPVPDAAAFLRQYDAIFTPDLTAILAQPAVRDRFITVAAVGGASKVTEIRLPVGPVTIEPPTTTKQDPSSGVAKPTAPPTRKPQRISFRAGGEAGQFSGALRAGEVESYVFAGLKGQRLTVRIDRVRERDIVAKVVDDARGGPLDQRAAEGARSWTGLLPADGDYRIDVVRLLNDNTPALTYMLVASLR